MRKLNRKNLGRRNRKNAIKGDSKENISLADLVTIFNEEAYKICKNRQIAKLIALNTLREYVLKYTKNLTIDL